MRWKRLKEWFDSPIINTKSQPKINATLDGNKCCGIAYGCWNNATANVLRNQSKMRSNEILECALFFFEPGSVYYI